MEKAIRDIQARLEAIEQDDTLYEDASFSGRQRALDAIEAIIPERVEGLRAVHGEREALLMLQGRAEAARNRLQAVNEGLFRRMREDIRSGALRGSALMGQLERYAGCSGASQGSAAGAYDCMDALVSGLFLAGGAPGEPKDPEPEMVSYQPTPARTIFQLVESASFEQRDTFYDLGSGLGQVVILVHLLSGITAKGVEVDPVYCTYARRCARDLNLQGVEFANADAREADVSDGTVFFLYTPFEGRMLQQVLERLEAQAKRRMIRVYTYGPCTFAVSRQGWLKPVSRKSPHVVRLAAFSSVGGNG